MDIVKPVHVNMAEYSPYVWKHNSTGITTQNQTYMDITGLSEIHVNLNDTSPGYAPISGQRYNWGVLFLTPIVMFGMAGNILVCMAVSMEKRLQTVTNYFLLSLAMTDLLVCFIVMPLSIVSDFFGHWPFNTALCNLFVTSDVLMCTSSILHLCSISLQRYLAISRPLKSRNKSKSVVILKIGFIWLTAATISSPVTVLGIIDPSNILTGETCVLQNTDFILYGSILAFFIPLVIMITTYVLTVRLLYKQSKLYKNGGSSDSGEIMIRRTKSGSRTRHYGQRHSSTDMRPRAKSLTRSENSYEMCRKSKSHVNIPSCGDQFLQIPHIPNIVSHSTSVESLYSNSSALLPPPVDIIPKSSTSFLNVPDPSRQGSSTESLVSDFSTDEDNNQKYKNQNFLTVDNGGLQNGMQRKRSIKVTKQLLEKASSILNLARERRNDKMSVKTEQKASKVLGFVFVLFVICWTPFFVVNILSAICKSCSFNPVLVSTFVWFGWISSTINPIIYTMFNSTFKQTFIKLVKCQYSFLQKSARGRYWSHSTGFQQKESSDSNAEIPL